MNLIESLSVFFILWEFIKIIFAKYFWNRKINIWKKSLLEKDKKNKFEENILKIISFSYIFFVFILIFSSYSIIGISLLFLSIIAILVFFPYIKKQQQLNFKIFSLLMIDSILSIFLLFQIYNPLQIL